MEANIKQLLLSYNIADRQNGWIFTKSILGIESIKARLDYCVDVYMEHLWCTPCIFHEEIGVSVYYDTILIAYNKTSLFSIHWSNRLEFLLIISESGRNIPMATTKQQLRDLIRKQVVLQIWCKIK